MKGLQLPGDHSKKIERKVSNTYRVDTDWLKRVRRSGGIIRSSRCGDFALRLAFQNFINICRSERGREGRAQNRGSVPKIKGVSSQTKKNVSRGGGM